MDLEGLNKTQLVLLALLVSFMTSLATGIVTVTLMDQAPPGVTQTINRIVKTTERVIVPQKTQEAQVTQTTVVVKEEDFIVKAAEKNSPNVVEIGYLKKKSFSFSLGGTSAAKEPDVEYVGGGFAVSGDGLIVLDKKLLRPDAGDAVVRTLDGSLFTAQVKLTRDENPLALLLVNGILDTGVDAATSSASGSGGATENQKPTLAERLKGRFTAVSFADASEVRVGQTAIALGNDKGLLLLIGVVSRVESTEAGVEGKTSVVSRIFTTIDADKRYEGGPVLNSDGKVIGITFAGEGGRYALPARFVQALITEPAEAASASSPAS